MARAVACGGGLYLPEGDAGAGRQAFEALACYQCHNVFAEDFPAPEADPPVPVVLGPPMNRKSRQYLAESIIAPSHRFARPRPEIFAYEPPMVRQREYENIKEGEVSRMGDFNDTLMVGEWIWQRDDANCTPLACWSHRAQQPGGSNADHRALGGANDPVGQCRQPSNLR